MFESRLADALGKEHLPMRLMELAGTFRFTRTSLSSKHCYRWVMMALAVIACTSGTAMAQLPFMFVDDAGVFEGNSGTTILKLPVRFVGTQNLQVTGTVSAIPLTGTGFHTPVGG